MKYYKFNDAGELKPILFGAKTRAVLSAELVVTILLVLFRVLGLSVPDGFEASLVVVVGVLIGFFKSPSPNERVMSERDAISYSKGN